MSKQADRSILTKNTRLKTKSRYLMHFIPHETILPAVFDAERDDSNQADFDTKTVAVTTSRSDVNMEDGQSPRAVSFRFFPPNRID